MKKLISIKTDKIREVIYFNRRTSNIYLFFVFLITVNLAVFSQKLSKVEIINGLYSGKCQFTNLDSKWKKDIDVAFNAVFIDGLNLKYVDLKIKNNNDIIQSAIWSNGYAINYVDKNKLKNIDSVRDVFDDSEIELLLNKYGKHLEEINLIPAVSKLLDRHLNALNLIEILKVNNLIWGDDVVESKDISNVFPSKEEILNDSSSILFSFNTIPNEFKNDTNIILNVLDVNINVLGLLDNKIQNELLSNRNFILQVIKRNTRFFKYIDSTLKLDRDFVLSAVQQNGMTLKYVEEYFKKDREIVLKAIHQDGLAFSFVDESLKGDKEIVLEAIEKSGYNFSSASDDLKRNKLFIIEAIKICKDPSLMDIDSSLLNDEEIKKLLDKQ